MKTLSISAVVVAGFLLAIGSGAMGGKSTGEGESCMISQAVEYFQGSSNTAACCPSSGGQVMVSTGADEPKSCCSGSSTRTLVVADAPKSDDKACAGGSCCASKDAKVLTSTEVQDGAKKECDGKDCKPDGACCEARQANVLTATEAKDGEQCEGTCPVSAAMAKLPKMTYAVGTEMVTCGEQAKQLAEQHKAPVVYVVGDSKFECPNAAMAALVDATETYVTTFTAPKKCETSGTVTIAGQSTTCSVEAAKRTELVATALKTVTMGYEVAGEKAACSTCAATMAKEKSAPIEYVVGEQKTTCEMTARLNLAHAKYKAAVQAMVSQTAQTSANAG